MLFSSTKFHHNLIQKYNMWESQVECRKCSYISSGKPSDSAIDENSGRHTACGPPRSTNSRAWTARNLSTDTIWGTIRARACGALVMPGLEESISHDTSPPPTRALMSDGDHAVTEQVKRYVFKSRKTQNCGQGDSEGEDSLEILIPEVRRSTVTRGWPFTAGWFPGERELPVLRAVFG